LKPLSKVTRPVSDLSLEISMAFSFSEPVIIGNFISFPSKFNEAELSFILIITS
tara:strand:- start:407 stop:568 length:162 start_codon:yes stop_codon:yes gene_type:complete